MYMLCVGVLYVVCSARHTKSSRENLLGKVLERFAFQHLSKKVLD